MADNGSKKKVKKSQDRLDAEKEIRRGQVAILLRGGMHDQSEIARKLGVSPSTITRDIQAIRRDWARRRLVLDYEFDLDLDRLSEMLRAVYVQARRGDHDAIGVVLKIVAQRTKMMGYDLRELLSRQVETDEMDMSDIELLDIVREGVDDGTIDIDDLEAYL